MFKRKRRKLTKASLYNKKWEEKFKKRDPEGHAKWYAKRLIATRKRYKLKHYHDKAKARYHSDPEYRKRILELNKKSHKERLKKQRALGLTYKGKVRMSKKAKRELHIKALVAYRESFGKGRYREHQSKIAREQIAKLSTRQRRERIEVAQKARLFRAGVRKAAKELFGKEFISSLRE